MKGSINEAIVWFKKVQDIPMDWKQIGHLCWWELMWCHWYVIRLVKGRMAGSCFIRRQAIPQQQMVKVDLPVPACGLSAALTI